jgi:beta-N-acetylhexosaminidase
VRDGTLTEDRLADASERRAALRRPGRVGTRPIDERLGREAAARALRIDGELAGRPLRGAYVVQCQPPDGMAQGSMPWGVGEPLTRLDPSTTVSLVTATADVAADLSRAEGRPLVVVVRDACRHRWQLGHLQRFVAARPDLVTVEMGWPGPDPLPGAAVIKTFGASRVSGEAVAARLAGEGGARA